MEEVKGLKGFGLNEQGDVVIEKNDIQIVSEIELLSQKFRQVLSTNKGEWWKNPKEGILVRKILKKNPNYALIKDYIRNALRQVDPSLKMTSCRITEEKRCLNIQLEITGANGAENITLEVG